MELPLQGWLGSQVLSRAFPEMGTVADRVNSPSSHCPQSVGLEGS